MISVTFGFENLEELQSFLKNYNQAIGKKTKTKKENDKRGYKTKEFHQAVKQFQQDNPNLSYLECLKTYKQQQNS
jgi:hypothetical protein